MCNCAVLCFCNCISLKAYCQLPDYLSRWTKKMISLSRFIYMHNLSWRSSPEWIAVADVDAKARTTRQRVRRIQCLLRMHGRIKSVHKRMINEIWSLQQAEINKLINRGLIIWTDDARDERFHEHASITIIPPNWEYLKGWCGSCNAECILAWEREAVAARWGIATFVVV